MLLLADTPSPFRDVVERFIAKRTLVVRCTREPAELLRSLRQDSIALLLIDVVAIGLSPLEEAEVPSTGRSTRRPDPHAYDEAAGRAHVAQEPVLAN